MNDMNMEKQTDMILRYMQDFESITPLDALREFGCLRLAARISDLRAAGWVIATEMESTTNKYGRVIKYARYRLENKYAE